jgi:SecD/SecF fusion protein
VPVSENTIGPTLGADTIESGTKAVVFAFFAVVIFMIFYYRFAGLVACVALTANLLLTVGFMVLVNATFTLPGLAGLVLMLGMAVDANVLIYERLREERDRGASLALALRNGYDRAFPTIIDTHLSSIFTGLVLYTVGNDQLKGFAISLTVGLIISLFTSLYMTRVMFDIGLAKGWIKQLKMMRILTRTNINFMSIRYYMFAATVALAVLGVALFVARGQAIYNIDFIGGTAYTGQLTELTTIGALRDAVSPEAQQRRLTVASVTQSPGDPLRYTIVYDDGQKTEKLLVTLPEEPRVALPEGATEEQIREAREAEVKRRASELPDVSVQQIFLNDPQYSRGDRSKVFEIRTLERSPQLVQASIGRLLGERPNPDSQGQLPTLAQLNMTSEIDKDGKSAVLNFTTTEAGNGEERRVPGFASPAQVRMLLERQFQQAGLTEAARQFVLRPGEGRQVEGRAEQLVLELDKLQKPVPADKLKEVLTAVQAQFDASPIPERLENFDATLAGETRQRAAVAILASWLAVLLYLWFRFGSWTFGLAAVICLIHDLAITLGIIAVCHYLYDTWPGQMLLLQDFKLDLAAVASLLTLVGYSVNDTIVVFDRIREVRGKNPLLTPQMINDSVNQTLSRTILTSFTTWLVVIVLYIFGGSGVHLFSFVMVVGILIGTYSSIYIASPLLLIFGEGRTPAGAPVARPQPAETA